LELGEQRLTRSVTVAKFEIGGGPSYEGSNFEGWNQGKPFLGFSGFWAGITFPISENFLGNLEWANQGAKSSSSAVLEQQRSSLQKLAIVFVWAFLYSSRALRCRVILQD